MTDSGELDAGSSTVLAVQTVQHRTAHVDNYVWDQQQSSMRISSRPWHLMHSQPSCVSGAALECLAETASTCPTTTCHALASCRFLLDPACHTWCPAVIALLVCVLQVPTDAELEAVLQQVQLHSLLDRCRAAAAAVAAVTSADDSNTSSSSSPGTGQVLTATSTPHAALPDAVGPAAAASAVAAAPAGSLASALDYVADWSGILSLGEQQRLAFARLLLAAPRLALLDEATSALDTRNEGLLYKVGLVWGHRSIVRALHFCSLCIFCRFHS